MRLAWLSDLHLNFVASPAPFLDTLAALDADALVITGDTGNSQTVAGFLKAMADSAARPIYFVLGNHDFYGSSFQNVRLRITEAIRSDPRLAWLTPLAVTPLTHDTALVGHDGWADGRLGRRDRSRLELTDFYVITTFIGMTPHERFAYLAQLGDAAAAHFRAVLPDAMRQYRHVIVATHVPPFREACWHNGNISDDDGLPYFACQAAGEAIRHVAAQFPQSRLTILCGHTHSPCDVQITPTIRVLAAHAVYGEPTVQHVFTL